MVHDPREPLTPDEVAVSHLYTALPRPEPSPALDARVLAQARAAVASTTAHPRRRTRPWYLMPGAGVAAAAVLAAGLAWQVGLLGDGRVQDMATESAPASAPAPAAARNEAKRDASLDVEFMRREQAVQPQADVSEAVAPEPAAEGEAARPLSAVGAAQRQRSQPPAPFPAEPPQPVIEEQTPMSTAAPPPAVPAAPAQAASEMQREAADSAVLDRVEVTGSRATRSRISGAAQLPPWPEDASLPPADWIERVRDRVRAGDREGARSSLRRFVRVHPAQTVPDDLTLLLVQ